MAPKSTPDSAGVPEGGSLAEATDVQLLEQLKISREALIGQIREVIVGQTDVIDQVLTALFCRGHAIMVGVPGLAKTLLVRTIAGILSLEFRRIQFTPDLMPSDIIGSDVLEEDQVTRTRNFRFIKGPVFTNMLLADEINRTPPKTQAALLEAMEEQNVTVGGQSFPLQAPFFVLATQNPIEQEGTYPLPEAQLDRFMLMIEVGYPSPDEERQIVRRTTSLRQVDLKQVMSAEQVIQVQKVVRKVPVAEEVISYAVDLVAKTRPQSPLAPDYVKKFVRWGAGPRASQNLILAAKARAAVRGQFSASVDDVRAVAKSVLRHRVLPNFHAESEGIRPDQLIERLMNG